MTTPAIAKVLGSGISRCSNDCSLFNRKPGEQNDPPYDCCGDCLDGYHKLDIVYHRNYYYICRENLKPRIPILPPTNEESSVTPTRLQSLLQQESSTFPFKNFSTLNITNTSQEETTPSTLFAESKDGLQPEHIVAIVCTFFGLILIVVFAFCFYMKKKGKVLPRGAKTGRKAESRKNDQPLMVRQDSVEDDNNNMTELSEIIHHTETVFQDVKSEVEAVPVENSHAILLKSVPLPFTKVQSFHDCTELERENEDYYRDSALGEDTPISLSHDSNTEPLCISSEGFYQDDDDDDDDGNNDKDAVSKTSGDSTEEIDPKVYNFFHVHQHVNISGMLGTSVFVP